MVNIVTQIILRALHTALRSVDGQSTGRWHHEKALPFKGASRGLAQHECRRQDDIKDRQSP